MPTRKISIRRIVQTLVTLVAVSGCVLALISADRIQSVRRVKDFQIHIRNSDAVHFVNDSAVQQALFSDRHIDAEHLTLAKLDVHNLENIARSNPWVSDAQVYIDNNRSLQIFLTQRVPVVRIFERSGQSYYLDTALQTVPLSQRYSHYTTIFTNVPMLQKDSIGMSLRGTISWLAQYVGRHPFWNAQIAEVTVRDDYGFEIVPILGRQRIIIGDTSRLDEKLTNLLNFYKQVQNKVGWDRYKILDLRYDGQVVASPALPWKVPVDKALTSMSWVKAIMESGPKEKMEAESDTLSANDVVPGADATPQQVAQPVSAPPISPPAAMKKKQAAQTKQAGKKPSKPSSNLKHPATTLHANANHTKHN